MYFLAILSSYAPESAQSSVSSMDLSEKMGPYSSLSGLGSLSSAPCSRYTTQCLTLGWPPDVFPAGSG